MTAAPRRSAAAPSAAAMVAAPHGGARRRAAWSSNAVAALLAACASLAAPAASVAAAEPEPLTVAAPPPEQRPGVERPLWELGLGVDGLHLPDYRGADQGRSYLLPLPYVVYRGRFLRADRDGARAVLLDVPRFEVDLSVAASVPTRSKDNAARAGMPDLPGTFEIGPNASIGLWRPAGSRFKLDLRLPLRAVVTLDGSPRHAGNTFSPNLNLDIAGVGGVGDSQGGGWNVGLLAGPLYGDRKYHALYYAVDAAQATSVRPAYRAAGGYAGWRALAATSRRVGNAWLGGFLRYDSLRGAVFADSPLVRRRGGVTAGFGVSWVLGTSSERVVTAD